jgi:RNA polymerase sigma factor (sigma-70 family)
MHEKRVRFEAEVLPHLDAAYRFARWLTHSSTDADDVVQEAILRAYRGFEGLRGSDAKGWLLAIVRNCHSTAVMRNRRGAAVPLPEEHDAEHGHAMVAADPGPEAESISRDNARTLNRLMALLPEEQREVLVLREIEDMDYRQIAAITNVPIGTVMSRLARARAALKVHWTAAEAGEPHAVR